jgi:2'-hydroxyisoflavone reductase
VQFIDARDLSEWIVRMAEARRAGTYNATGPDYRLTMGGLLEECRRTTESEARFVWMDEKFLLEAGLAPWMEVPLWTPEGDETNRYFLSVSVARAIAGGLTFRPLAETIDRAREREVLDAWQTQRAGSSI